MVVWVELGLSVTKNDNTRLGGGKIRMRFSTNGGMGCWHGGLVRIATQLQRNCNYSRCRDVIMSLMWMPCSALETT